MTSLEQARYLLIERMNAHLEMSETGWTCRRCSNGDHKNCELEQRGLYCVCVTAQCGLQS